MPITLANLVAETATTPGTGAVTLAGALSARYQTFNAAFGTGSTNQFRYVIHHRTALEWEVGIGYLSASTTLVRELVTASSNANALVNFTAGTKDVLCSVPASALQQAIVAPLLTYTTGLYHSQGIAFAATLSIQAEARIYPVDYPPDGVVALDRIAVWSTVVGSAGSVVRMGLYSSDATGRPGALLLDAGTIDTATGIGLKAITISATRVSGRVWMCAVPQGAPGTLPTLINITNMAYDAGSGIEFATPAANIVYTGYSATGVTGALPDPWTSTTVTNIPYRLYARTV